MEELCLPGWVYLLPQSPNCLILSPSSGLSSWWVPSPDPAGWRPCPAESVLVEPGHQNSLQHCPRLPASHLDSVNEDLGPGLLKTRGNFPGLPLQAEPTQSSTPAWPGSTHQLALAWQVFQSPRVHLACFPICVELFFKYGP